MKIIINADDYGMSVGINEAIHELALLRTISSVSVMANMPYAYQITELINKTGISIGLHINLTQGKSISPQGEINTLVDKCGNFYSKDVLLKKISNNEVLLNHIQKEIYAQYVTLKLLINKEITHVDSHQGILHFPIFFKAIINISLKYNIRFILRVKSKYYIKNIRGRYSIIKPSLYNIFKFGIKRVTIEYYYSYKKKRWRKYFKTTDGMLFCKNHSVLLTLKELNNINYIDSSNRIYIISCHPAKNTNELFETTIINERIREYIFLKSNEFIETINNIGIYNYSHIK